MDLTRNTVLILKDKLLIIGGSGFVGSTLANYAINDYDIFLTYNKNKPINSNFQSFQINLLDNRDKIIDLIHTLKPNFIVHTAAHSSVDLCETNHTLANELHIDVTKDIAIICNKINSKLIYLSTDAVFDGNSIKNYSEKDKPNPVNHYGFTKLNAEKIILNASKQNVILRTAVIYGWHKKSRFSNWIIETLNDKKRVDPHIDQYNSPTLVDDLAKVILKIIKINISGLFHAAGKTCVNRYEFASLLADGFNLDKNLITPVTTLEKKQLAPRPKHTCLNSNYLEKSINFRFCDLFSGVQFIYKQSQNI